MATNNAYTCIISIACMQCIKLKSTFDSTSPVISAFHIALTLNKFNSKWVNCKLYGVWKNKRKKTLIHKLPTLGFIRIQTSVS